MGATTVDIAEAVKEALNGGSFSQAFGAVRAYRPEYDLEGLKDLRVTVVPKALEVAPVSRGSANHNVDVDVAVQKRTGMDTSAVDALMALVEEIADYFRQKRLPDHETAVWVGATNEPVYSPEHLREHGVFTSVLTLSFRVVR